MSTDAQIIRFPLERTSAPRSCFQCAYYSENYCHLFEEQIDSELFAAADCDAFETNQ